MKCVSYYMGQCTTNTPQKIVSHHIYIYVYMCMYMYAYVYVYIYVYICVYNLLKK